MAAFCYLNGEILPLSEASVGLYDIGLLRGFGIYEGLRSCNRKPFAFQDHMARFHRSAKQLHLSIPISDDEMERIMGALIERNVPSGKEGLIRVILTGGPAIHGIDYSPATPTLYVVVETLELPEARYFKQGCAIATYEHQRQFPQYKTTNYIQAVLLQKMKEEKDVLEVLYVYEGKMLEATGSNLFIVSQNTLITPKERILLGITRKVVIELSRPQFKVEERDVSVEEMFGADEVFLTSSFKDVVPVVTIDGRSIGSGAPGPITKRVMELFENRARTWGATKSASLAAAS